MCWIVFILGCVSVCTAQVERKENVHNVAELNETPRSASDPLNILLMAVPASGHVNPLLALGEELTRRGHNVTLCLPNNEKFSEKMTEKAAQSGVKFIATGKSVMSTVQGSGMNSPGFIVNFPLALASESKTLITFLDAYINEENKVDIIIGEEFVVAALVCATQKFQLPAVVMSSTLLLMPYTYPSWPWPGPILGATSDDLTFSQRLLNTFGNMMTSLLFNYFLVPLNLNGLGEFCPNIQRSYTAVAPGTHIPQIVPSAIGLEYPRTISPLVHYVGPVLTKSSGDLPRSLHSWLNTKEQKSVIYISMGSHLPVTDELVMAITNGIATTNYSAVWSLRGNTDILNKAQIKPEKLFVPTGHLS